MPSRAHLDIIGNNKSMTSMAERETSAEIDAAAALWAVRVDGDALSAEAKGKLEAWLAADVRRLGAYARARAMLVEAGRVKALGTGFDPAAYALEHGVADSEATEDWRNVALHPTRRKFLVAGSVAAASAVAAIGLSWPAAATTYTTRRGEIRLVPLADGSSMTLNTQTIAKVLFTSDERHIELIEGEALFDVARDSARPFVVEAGASLMKAVATSFTVSRLPGENVKVTVRQGSVRLGGLAPSQPQTVLTANMRAVVTPDMAKVATGSIAASEMNRDIAWQQGMLSFEDTPLSQAAIQFARYSDTAIRFDDPTIGEETITGLYAANDPQGFARSAALSLGIKARAQSGGITLGR